MFHDGRLDVGISGTRAPRRRERVFTGDAPRLFYRLVCLRIVSGASGIMDPKDIERRLVHEHITRFGDYSGNGTHCVADGRVLGHEELGSEAACHFRVIGAYGSADGDQRRRKTDSGIDEL